MIVADAYAGKVALVTGSRRGVGRLIAEHFLQHGARVIGFARGPTTINHPEYSHIQIDIGDAKSVQSGFVELKKTIDALHIVVNNAAILTSQYAMIMPPAAAQAMLNTNLMGPFMVSREASKMMRKTKWGRIINIGSMAASLEPIGDSMYAACKAGLATLANVMAKELAPLNVTCNTLAISAIKTDMLAQLPQGKITQVIAGLPMPRFAEPDDILNVLDFLVSERSSYITAQTIYLGGVNLNMAALVGNWGGGAVWRVTSGIFQSNAYFCEADVPGGCILIDAGLDGPAIDAAMSEHGFRPHQVFCTHGHFDHAGSAAYFQKKYGCQVFMHQADARTLKASNFLLMAFKIPQKIEIPEITYIERSLDIDIYGETLTYLPTPGHTLGSCILQFGNAWFTGDTIYSQGVGLSSLPGEDAKSLRQSILRLWDRLSEDLTIFPGHGNVASSALIRSENRALLKFLELVESDREVQ